MTETNTVASTGFCFCGCGEAVAYGNFFSSGHDKTAEAAFLAIHHQASVAALLVAHGYGSDSEASVTRAAVDAGLWEKCPDPSCTYRGAPASIRNHLRKSQCGRKKDDT
jgi:hypothetical protein